MLNNENDFKKVIGRLNIDDKPNDEHRDNLRQQMMSEFNEVKQKFEDFKNKFSDEKPENITPPETEKKEKRVTFKINKQ